jgi:hypothetical protein
LIINEGFEFSVSLSGYVPSSRLVQNNICSLSPHQHISDRLQAMLVLRALPGAKIARLK